MEHTRSATTSASATARAAHWGQAGIAIGESDHTTIENNTCVLNPPGITLREIGPRECKGIDREHVN